MDDVGNEKQVGVNSLHSYADSIDRYLEFDGEVEEKREKKCHWMIQDNSGSSDRSREEEKIEIDNN